MAWMGYFEYGGAEVINASRTEAYAKVLPAFKPVYKNDALGPLLGETYSSPLQDDAPWCDPDDLDTYDFYGVYPLDITGVEDSTWSASVTENTKDGGTVSRVRHASRTVVFSAALIGANDCAVLAGLRWLKAALGGRPCLGPQEACGGHDMCFLSCAPSLDWSVPGGDPTTCLDSYLRSMHQVTLVTGPNVDAKMTLTSGGEVWVVSFTAVAGNPYIFGAEVPLIVGFMDPSVDIPYVGGVVPDGASFDADGSVQTEVACPVAVYSPLVDPLCPQVIAPPTAPLIALSCFDFPVNFVRRQFIVPASDVPLWGEIVPLITVKARTHEVRNLRLRFYADVMQTGDPSSDPCNYCGDIVFSYVPANSTLVFDGSDEQVYVETVAQGRRRADSLVFASDGGPFDWPQLSCGFDYIVTWDMPQTSYPPIVDFSFYRRNP